MDIAEEILNMPKLEREEFRKKHPYEVISKTCDYDRNFTKKLINKTIFNLILKVVLFFCRL